MYFFAHTHRLRHHKSCLRHHPDSREDGKRGESPDDHDDDDEWG